MQRLAVKPWAAENKDSSKSNFWRHNWMRIKPINPRSIEFELSRKHLSLCRAGRRANQAEFGFVSRKVFQTYDALSRMI